MNASREAFGEKDAQIATFEYLANRAISEQSNPRAVGALDFETALPLALESVRKRLSTLRSLADCEGLLPQVRERALKALKARQDFLISKAPLAQDQLPGNSHVQAVDDILKAEGKACAWPWYFPRRQREFLDVRLEEIKDDLTGDLEDTFAKDYEFRWNNIGTLRAIYLTQDSSGQCDILNHFLSFATLNRGNYHHAASIIGEFLINFIPNSTWESFVSVQTSNACDDWSVAALDWLRLKVKCDHEELTEDNLRLAIKIAEKAQIVAKKASGAEQLIEKSRLLAEACEHAARNAIARKLHATHVARQNPDSTDPAGNTVQPNLNEGLIKLLDAGTTLGKYHLIENIGGGAYGEVWKAQDEALERTVALKFPSLPTRATLDRLKREAQAAAKLDHPNIAGIYAVEELSGRQFIAMQYVDGLTLDRFDPPSSHDLLRILRDIAAAVHFAHVHNVVHRDLKPGNILVTRSGVPFVTDFGLARITQSVSKLTSTGTFVGTWPYASPQQRNCQEVDERADVFSLGVTIHELVTGALPSCQESKSTAVAKPYPPELHGLEDIVQKCLHHLPEDRYESAQELARALEELLPEQDRTLAQKSPKSLSPEGVIQVTAVKVPKDSWGTSGYDLLLSGTTPSDLDGATVSFRIPDGFALLRTAKPGGWHQDPSIDRPRTWLTPPDKTDAPLRIGRLCFHDLSIRLKTPKGAINWGLKLPGRPKIDGTTELDLEALLPLTSRPALGSSRRLSFEECKTIGEVPYEAGRKEALPTLILDETQNLNVLASPGQDDSPTYLHFSPGVSIIEAPAMRLRWKAKSSKHLMIHLFFGGGDEAARILTLKSFKAGDVADRPHSEREWVSSLGPAFGSGTWATLTLNLSEILQKRFGPLPFHDFPLKKMSMRGDYRLESLEFLDVNEAFDAHLPIAESLEVLKAEPDYVVLKCGKCNSECLRPWIALVDSPQCSACGGVLHPGCANCHQFPKIDDLSGPIYFCTHCKSPSH